MTFTNSITGENGVLIRNQIESPNFVTGVSGWIVRKDGTVEFTSGVFRGNIVLNQLGAVLEYTGAGNNLGVALAPASGSDVFGNTYSPGLNVYDSLGTATGTWGGATGFSMQDPNNQLIRMSLAVPVFVLSPTFNDGSPGIIKAVRSDVIANHDTLQILGPQALASIDPNVSGINYKVTAGNSANGADARFVFHNNGGDTVLLQMNNGLVQLPLGATLNSRATINSSSPSGAISIFQNVATSNNPGTISIQETAAGNGSFAAFVSGDSHARFVIRASGEIDWSSGAASADTKLDRNATGYLEQTSGGITGPLAFSDTSNSYRVHGGVYAVTFASGSGTLTHGCAFTPKGGQASGQFTGATAPGVVQVGVPGATTVTVFADQPSGAALPNGTYNVYAWFWG